MTIDKKQLISLLEEKTGLEHEQVETQLSKLINRIQKAAEQNKTFEVEGFGTFSMEDGSLQFEPDDTLETEINNKYAGMKPIELIGAYKKPESDQEVPEVDMSEAGSVNIDSEDKWTFDTDATKEEQGTEASEHKPELDEEEIPEAENVSESDNLDKEQKEAEEVFDAVFGTTVEEPDVTEDPKPSKPQESVAEEIEKEEPRDPIGTIIVAVVVILVLGIGGWFAYDFGFMGTDSNEMSSASPQRTETVGPADSNMESETESVQDERSMEPEQSSAVSKREEDGSSQQTTQQQNRYGLMGRPNQNIANGYTIVVHSLRDQQQAEQNRKQLQQAGYRALISQAQVEGSTYYRVGIGQFETISDAQEAIRDIPKQYRDNNFIKRIQ